jgi:hypothetical protein
LRTRGHRLVYSNGILALTVVSALLLIVTRARVASLIPLYACTVFTGFTMAGAGMTKYHLTHRIPNHRRHLAVAFATFVASGLVTLIFVVTEFVKGAWLVVVCIPIIVFVLTRTKRRYEEERRVLAEDSTEVATDAPILRRHIVLVLVDSLDLATARAVQLARSLSLSGEVRAVHFVLDHERANAMAHRWNELGRWRIPLELIECPDRRLGRAATEMVSELASNGDTEVTLVLPRRLYPGVANRLLHSNTADRIVSAVSTIENVSATIAPFDVGDHLRRRKRVVRASRQARSPQGVGARFKSLAGETRPARIPSSPEEGNMIPMEGFTPIGEIVYRQRSRICGRVHSVRVQPWSNVQAVECTVVDGSGAVNVVFLGRRSVPGLEVGTKVTAEGMVGKHDGRLAIINPSYELLQPTARENPAVS